MCAEPDEFRFGSSCREPPCKTSRALHVCVYCVHVVGSKRYTSYLTKFLSSWYYFFFHHLDVLLFRYESTLVEGNVVVPVETKMQFKTERAVPKVGVMLIGLGGNNGW